MSERMDIWQYQAWAGSFLATPMVSIGWLALDHNRCEDVPPPPLGEFVAAPNAEPAAPAATEGWFADQQTLAELEALVLGDGAVGPQRHTPDFPTSWDVRHELGHEQPAEILGSDFVGPLLASPVASHAWFVDPVILSELDALVLGDGAIAPQRHTPDFPTSWDVRHELGHEQPAEILGSAHEIAPPTAPVFVPSSWLIDPVILSEFDALPLGDGAVAPLVDIQWLRRYGPIPWRPWEWDRPARVYLQVVMCAEVDTIYARLVRKGTGQVIEGSEIAVSDTIRDWHRSADPGIVITDAVDLEVEFGVRLGGRGHVAYAGLWVRIE